jgi:exodeoxyribonuclease V beta subunit
MNAPLLYEPLPLNPLVCPLDGVNLIEASAGTGKTWTIAALYLRLLLEQQADGAAPPRVDQLLVVTYTKAATAELRDRLRARLAEAAAAFAAGAASDPLLHALLEQHPDRARARARLEAALTGFDAASVYTIHGFCQRVLTDAAFESGQSFSAELVSDDAARLQEMAADFWRTHLVHDAQLARLLVEAGDTPQAWLADIRAYLGKPYLCADAAPSGDLAQAEGARNQAWAALLAQDDVDTALDIIRVSKALNGRSYTAKVRERVCLLIHTLLQGRERPQLDKKLREDLARLTPQRLTEHTKHGEATPCHALFDCLGAWLAAEDELQQALAAKRAELKLDLLAWLNAEQAARRQQSRERSFDDLLTDLAAALEHPEHGELLAQHLARTWQVALIDEFQDTDPVQYSIFQRGFIHTGRAVFLVGDPKQAIYSFRGADIFAYLDAKDIASRHYTLATNFRSSPELVAAVNQLFQRAAPFVLDGIDYRAVSAKPGTGPGIACGDDRAPFHWLTLPGAASGKPLSKERAQALAAAACADEIAGLLRQARAGRASLTDSGAPLCGGDIAVLVATHRQGEAMRAALAARGVKSVALSQDSVFASREAQELAALLRAWAEPSHEGLLREALATELVGLSAADIAQLVEDENGWEALRQHFAADHACWRERGFMPAWWRFYARAHVAERLLPLPDGERRLTNLAHLAELLQRQSEAMPGIAPLAAWFDATVAAPPSSEDALMRLESDAELVKIVTIHTSKGLQYPVVFCPFLWDGTLERRETLFWRYRDGDRTRLTPSAHYPGSAAARDKALTEALSEKLRLLYVALTRAQFRQYVVWGPVSHLETAALSWLLHAPEHARGLADLEGLDLAEQGLVQATVARWVEQVGAAAGWSGIDQEAAPVCLPPLERAGHAPTPRRIERAIYTPWRVTSFTALAHRADAPQHLAEAPDHEQAASTAPPLETPAYTLDRFSFPRGARAGVCLHSMFEHIDFGADAATLSPVIATELKQAGFAEHWHAAALDIVQRTLNASLDPGVSLAAVPATRRLVEMEFMLPIRRLDVAALKTILADPAYRLAAPLRQAAASLDFPAIAGFLKGFIDLVFEANGRFYVVDYKSNHLGPGDADYAPAQLAEPIAREHYYLQYLFYSVALRRYLKTRGLARAPISVRYLFLRGLNQSGNGVWCDEPALPLLDALDAWLG